MAAQIIPDMHLLMYPRFPGEWHIAKGVVFINNSFYGFNTHSSCSFTQDKHITTVTHQRLARMHINILISVI